MSNILRLSALAGLLAFSFYFQRVRDKAEKYEHAIAELAQERGRFAAWKVQQRQSHDASAAFQSELAQLRTDLVKRPAPVIRVCPQSPSTSAAPTAVGSADAGSATGAAPAGGIHEGAGVSEPAGRDIGPPVQSVFARCEQLSAQVRAILHQGE